MIRHLLAALLPLFLAASAAAAPAPPASPASPPPKADNAATRAVGAGAPVLLDGKPLFLVRERVLSFTPEDRAGMISGKLSAFLKSPLADPHEISVIDGESASEIMAGELVLMAVTDRDAAAEGKGRKELAEARAEVLRAAVARHIDAYRAENLGRGAFFAVLATFGLVAVLLLYRWAFMRLYALLDSWEGTRIRPIRVQKIEILGAGSIVAALKAALRWVRILATLLLFYLYVPLVLNFFPWTHGYAAVLVGYILGPLGIVGKALLAFLPNLFFIAVVGLVTHYTLHLIRIFFLGLERGAVQIRGFYPEWALPTFKIVRVLVVAFAAVVAFPYIPGSDSPAFRGVSIFLGVLFSLGSTSAIANVVSGFVLTYMRAFRAGDRVKIADSEGDVVEKTLLVTRIRTIKNVDVTIPNSMILASHIVNYSSSAKEAALILHTAVTIGYDTEWRRVHELLLEAASRTEGLLAEPPPFVLQTALNDFFATYELNVHTDRPREMAATYSRLHQNIQDAFNEGGVEILSPHYSQLRDGNATGIPERYRPAGYEPGAIRVAPRPGSPP